MQLAKLSPLDFWKIISLFSSYDPNMPKEISMHLLDIEKYILFDLIWQQPKISVDILS